MPDQLPHPAAATLDPPGPAPGPGRSGGGWLQRWTDHPGEQATRLWHTLAGHAAGWMVRYGVPAAVVVVAVVAGCSWWRRRLHARREAGGRLLLVRPPAAAVPATGGVVLWRNLAGLAAPVWKRLLFGQPHLSLEYAFDPDGLRLAVWVPGGVPPGLVEGAVRSAWPGAQIRPADPGEAERRPAGHVVAGGALGLAQPEWFGLQVRHEADPLRPLLEVGAGLAPTDTVRVQVLARPAAPYRIARLRRAARQLRNGRAAGRPEVFTRGVNTAVSTAVDLFTPGPGARRTGTGAGSGWVDPFLAEDLRAVRDKTSHPLWEVAVRYAMTAPTRGQARGAADAVAGAFAVFAGRNQLRRHRLPRPDRVLAGRRLMRGFCLSVPELAALAHLPYEADAPGVDRAGARTVAPHPRVPGGPAHAETAGVKVLGDADAGPRRPIGLRAADARQHLHVLGATGSGKSTLLAHLVLQDVAAGRGVVLIDPKGDLVTELLEHLPAAAAGRVMLFDPDDPALPAPRLNPLDGGDPALAADHVVGIFARIYAAWWGPRTEDVLRAAVLTLLHPANAARPDLAHLGSVPRLLVEDAFRRRATTPLTADRAGGDRTLAGFWTWYEGLSEAGRAQVVGPVMNKLRAFLLRPFARTVVAAGPSTVDMGGVLDRGGICLVRLPKGTLGEDATRLLGSFVLARTWQAATARARTGQTARADCSVVLDEAHNFLTLPHSLEDILAEARGYRLALTLALPGGHPRRGPRLPPVPDPGPPEPDPTAP